MKRTPIQPAAARFTALLKAMLPALALFGCAPAGDGEATADLAIRSEGLTAVVQINSGGSTVGGFVADRSFSGGQTYSNANAITTTGVADAAPAAVYQSERYGDFTYSMVGLAPSTAYTVRLHFAEIWFTEANRRVFDVAINGTQVLNDLDIFTTAGGANRALVREFNASSDASGQIRVTYASVTDYAKSSGIEILTGGTSNQAPTIQTAAAASPSSTSGTSSSLSVLGADDGGETNLRYTWSVVGTPPSTVTFTPNGTNAAKSSTATFSASGTYNFLVTVADQPGLTATSSVTVVKTGAANQAPTVATGAAANPNPVTGTTSSLSVLGADDGGESNLAYVWSVTGTPPGSVSFSVNDTNAAKSTVATFGTAGNYSLRATIRDAAGLTTTSNLAVSVGSASAPVHRVNSGGPAVAPFAADQFFTGGSSYSTSTAVSTTGVTNAAPAAVYQSERYGNHSYTFAGLAANTPYTVRLHFAEIYFTATGRRVFNVAINGSQVLTNFDIFAAAGANKAHVRDFTANTGTSGQIVVQYTTVSDNAKSSAIEIIGLASGGTPPTVATAATASPNPVTAKTTALSVLGADDGGEANLTYTWATTGTPPGSVSFSANATNAAKNTTATFGAAGSYSLQVAIRDATNATATSNVNVTVNQTLTTLSVSPSSASVQVGTTRQFSASASDQFGNGMTAPSLTWTVNGGGSINTSGLFTAGTNSGGPFSVTATGGGKSGTATVMVTAAPPTGGRLLLRTDPTKRFLVDGDGVPFLVRGDAAWTLSSQLDVAGQNNYMDTRSAQGLNAFSLMLISVYQNNAPNDAAGLAPFTTPNDFATFNPAYFQKIVDLLNRASQRGMVAFVAPAWAGYDGSQGFYNAMIQNGTTKLRNYGVAIGNMFKDVDNIVWMIGGDKPAPVGSTAVFDALTEGIRSVDTRHLVTSHWNFAPGDVPNGNWTDIVSAYDWNGGVQYTQIRGEYDENEGPVVLLEALYELNTAFGYTPKIMRLQTLHALLFGAKGAFFGHEGVWHLGSTNHEALGDQSEGKPYDLNSVGIQHQQRIHAMFVTRAWQDLVPDLSSQLVTSGRGSYGSLNYVSAAKTPNGRLAMICVPNAGTIGVNLARLTLPVTAKWLDPTDGSSRDAGSYSTAETRNFTSPGNNASGDNDWVLVFDSN
jgi:hypothetical protein